MGRLPYLSRNLNQILPLCDCQSLNIAIAERAGGDRHPHPEDIFLIIVVAKTSLKKDIEIKAAIYAEDGIQEYWVLNLAAKNAIAFRDPQIGKYVTVQTISAGMLTPLAFADIQV